MRTPKTESQTLADLKLIREILSYRRRHDGAGEREFIRDILEPLNPTRDEFGNFYIEVDDSPFLWSCHIDSVHHDNMRGKSLGTRQLVDIKVENGIAYAQLHKAAQRAGNCLGADNGAGIFILLNMIAAKIPGTYVFHRGEEFGCLGSHWIKENCKDWLRNFSCAVAFDRLGESEIITHQMGMRTTSDAFAQSLADELARADSSINLAPSSEGAYTDTDCYHRIIPECSNVSCGYTMNHGPREKLNLNYLFRLKNAILKIDLSRLIVDRDPDKEEDKFARYITDALEDDDFDKLERLIELCRDYPEIAAALICELGADHNDFLDCMMVAKGYVPSQEFDFARDTFDDNDGAFDDDVKSWR